MRLCLFLFLTLFTIDSYSKPCLNTEKVKETTSSCQMSYFKFAPECSFGDGLCLSLVLHGLVNKNLFDYRPDIRRTYNTPLKRKVFKKTKEYQKIYNSMIDDLEVAKESEFCAEMNTYWVYDLTHKGFSFLSHTLIPKSKLYLFTNVSKIGTYDFISVDENNAIEIESWENISASKFVFFKIEESKNYIPTGITRFIWFDSKIDYDYEGNLNVSCEKDHSQSLFEYKVSK